MSAPDFIPGTMARHIGDGVYFRPIRSWHSGTFAGEHLTDNRGDGSGCIRKQKMDGQEVCPIPLSVTHRLYWHESAPEKTLSAFLSYPGGMGYFGDFGNGVGTYFWEAHKIENDIQRWATEEEMETELRKLLAKP